MTLIDADDLFMKYVSLVSNSISGIKFGEAIELLEDAPTVEAIPIEWIIKWNEDYAPKDYREMTEDMIADWREEQGDEAD